MGEVEEARHPEWRVRLEAAQRLGSATDEESVDVLAGMLSDDNTAVVDAAAESLVRREARGAFIALLRAVNLDDGEGDQVLDVFARHRGSWLTTAALALLGDRTAPATDRATAAEVLGYPLLATDARPALVEALDSDRQVAEAARDALARLDRWGEADSM